MDGPPSRRSCRSADESKAHFTAGYETDEKRSQKRSIALSFASNSRTLLRECCSRSAVTLKRFVG
jgi:hypothetical protein